MNLGIEAKERGAIILDFAIREVPIEKRKTVAETYPEFTNGPYGNWIIVAMIQATGEDLVVPPEVGKCSYLQKPSTNLNKVPLDGAKLVEELNGQER